MAVAPAGSAAAADAVSALSTALSTASSRVLPALYDSYASKGTATLGVADSGQTWTNFSLSGSTLSVINGQLTNTATAAATRAGYIEANLGAPVKRIAAEFVFASAGSTNAGSAVLVIWKTTITALGTTGVPDSPLHFTITPTTWGASFWSGGSATGGVAGTFATPLTCDGSTVYRAAAELVNNTLYLMLPDGTCTTVTDSLVTTNAGNFASFEVYQQTASTDHKAAFVNVWADVS